MKTKAEQADNKCKTSPKPDYPPSPEERLLLMADRQVKIKKNEDDI